MGSRRVAERLSEAHLAGSVKIIREMSKNRTNISRVGTL